MSILTCPLQIFDIDIKPILSTDAGAHADVINYEYSNMYNCEKTSVYKSIFDNGDLEERVSKYVNIEPEFQPFVSTLSYNFANRERV